MENDPSPFAPEPPRQERLKDEFLSLLRTEHLDDRAAAVCQLFLENPWFQELLVRRAGQAVACHAVPGDFRDDLQQEMSLIFVQKARRSPDLHINAEIAETHFGGWVWTIVDHLAAEAIKRLHRIYRSQGCLAADVALATKRQLDWKIDLAMELAKMPLLTRSVLSLFDEGYTIKEIAQELGEKYWKVYDAYRRGVELLREKIGG